jgi:hypothetical protein
MSNLINMNKRTLITDNPIVSWKGKTLTQITSVLNKNNNISNINYYSPNPLKIYRRELATNIYTNTCNTRASVKIDEFDRPGGSVVYLNDPFLNNPKYPKSHGLVNTLDINLINNRSDIPGNCSSCINTKVTTGSSGKNAPHAFSPAQNALRRVRSGGMIKRQFDITSNKPTYYVNNNQYLQSRNKTLAQNQYTFLVSGNTTAKPGTTSAMKNFYAANGTSKCTFYGRVPVYYKPNNSGFAQQGAVTSSSHITRVKFDSISNSSVIYRRTLGASIANVLAYGVQEPGYTVKDILGYPNKKTPVIDKYTGELKKCNLKKLSHEI